MLRVVFQRKFLTGSIITLVFMLAVGAASARSLAQQRSGDAAAARNAMSSTHLLSRAQGQASRVMRHSGTPSLLGSTSSRS